MTNRGLPVSRRDFFARTLATMIAAKVAPAALARPGSPNERLQVALVGCGGRGMQVLRGLGYFLRGTEDENPRVQPRLESIEIRAICDAFDDHLTQGVQSVRDQGGEATGYVDYREMLARERLDAVIVTSPDHLHAPVAIAAMEAGCDVYVEKCVANSLEELAQLEETVRRTGRILQAGHQGRQDSVHLAARAMLQGDQLGKVTLVQSFLSRGGREQAWLRDIANDGGPPRERVHWEQFLGPAPRREYDPHRFFEWRRYWDYSTGIAGDLMSHELDTIHHVLDLGPPRSAVASGGVYYWKDGRETPDTYSVVLEYPEHDLSVSYGANLHNNFHRRPTIFLGEHASLELDWEARLYAERTSPRHAEDLRSGKIEVGKPLVVVGRHAGKLVGRAATSELWLEAEGLLLTTRDGVVRDTSRLHFEEFFDCVRHRGTPSAGIEQVYAPTVATHLTVLAYKTGKRVTWDPETRTAVY